ncbi:MAG: PIN domain-containing protein [Gammaproteobacteria bacterium]|nr:PIN domain-containing protein [Gammaproteobacteria bacterium]
MIGSILIDTNLLIYQFDERDRDKQALVRELLADRIQGAELTYVPHQAIIEFVAAATRLRPSLNGQALLSWHDAMLEAEQMMQQYDVIYPNSVVLHTALRGARTYGLAWFDAHLWAFAEVYGIPEILSEDFQHGRYYGSVRVTNPFAQSEGGVRELPPVYG